ncbi:MAG: hypothetical protein EZS28_050028, partial [Streblomastix strix]
MNSRNNEPNQPNSNPKKKKLLQGNCCSYLKSLFGGLQTGCGSYLMSILQLLEKTD